MQRIYSFLFLLALGFALVAVALVGLPANRYLLLKVPKYGYKLYGMFGGNVPCFIDYDIYLPRNQNQWRGPKDVFASVPAKSGTTWMMNTLHHIRARGAPPQFRDIYEEVRWSELTHYPGQPMQERIKVIKRTAEKYFPFAAYKTHATPQQLHYREDAYYVVTVRNIVDVAASLFPFLRSHDEHFAAMFGGFPINSGQPERPGDLEQYEYAFLVDSGGGTKPLIDALVLDCIAGFWPLRNATNVLFVHYNDRIANHRGEIARIAEFINWPLTPRELDLVAERTTFQYMKSRSSQFDPTHVLKEFKLEGKIPPEVTGVVRDMVNVGSVRKGSKELRPEFVNAINAYVEQRFGKEIAHWIAHGGAPLPNVDLPHS